MGNAKTIDKTYKNMYHSTIPVGTFTDMKPISSIHVTNSVEGLLYLWGEHFCWLFI